MADTTAQKQAELWVVQNYLPRLFGGLAFEEREVKLIWGGYFAFDAVSLDSSVVGLVSTSLPITCRGKQATAKFQKLKADCLYLMHVALPCRKLMAFTEESMKVHFEKERLRGRFPPEIELIHAPLPHEISEKVLVARAAASKEVTPSVT